MTSDFIPLLLKWRLVAGANLPGFRAAEANADGEWPTAGASPSVAEADSLMRAIAAGATEDELVVVATGALTTLYHLLAQLAARRLLEVSVEFDGEVLCCLLPRSRDFHLPGEIEMPRRIVLDRFAYLRAGRRGAVLQSPDVCCDIVAESATFSALIPRLAATPINRDDLQRREQRSLLALLVALGFAGDADAPESPSRRVWQFHDRLFHASSQLHDDGVARGATYRFRDRLAPPPAIRPRHHGTEIALPDLGLGIESGRTLLDIMNARRSCRDLEDADLTLAELGEVLGRVGRMTVKRQQDDKEFLARPIPSAGGLQALEFYIATSGCIGLPAGFFHYRSDIHGLTHISRGDNAAKEMLRQCARAWDGPDRLPSMLVVLAVRLPRIAWKYEGIAYRLALLDAGVVLQSLYLVVTDLGLAGAAVGASDPELFAQASGIESWEETCVAAFGFGRPRVSLLGLEDNAGAAQALEAAIATDPAGLASLAIGLTLVRLGRPAAAVDYLRQAQALQADVGSSRKMVEDILRASALLATGSTSISTADQAEVYQQLGTTLRTLGYFDDASRALNEALMLRPGMPAATAALDSLVDIAKAPDSFVPKEASATALPELAADRLSQYLALFADRRTLGKSRYNPNSEIKSGKVVLWCIVPKYRVQWPGTRALSSASGDGGGCLVLALRASCESGFPQMAVNSYSSVPRSASSALKGSCFSSKAMSRSEIAKAAGLIGAASGAVLTRRRKPSAELKPVEPQRRLQPSLKESLALLRV